MTASDKPIVNSLWIGNRLSPLEVLTIKSFQANGYKFRLWVYDLVENIPESTIVADAGKIIPHKEVFNYTSANKYGHGKGSYAGFSDIFRYKLLYEEGGIWSDMDITCIKPLRHDTDYIFRYHKQLGVVGNFMQCPKGSELMKWCYDRAANEVKSDNQDWLLPIRILNEGVVKYGLHGYIQRFSNEDSFPVILKMLRNNQQIPDEWHIIHWMNEEFRRMGYRKDHVREKCTLAHFYTKYGIPFTQMDKMSFKESFNFTKVYYTWVNLKARFVWIKEKVAGKKLI